MPIDEIKKQLVSLIENTNDEQILFLMKEDFSFYTTTEKDTDITDELTEKQFMELKALAEEPSDKDAMSVDEFKKATQQWRTK